MKRYLPFAVIAAAVLLAFGLAALMRCTAPTKAPGAIPIVDVHTHLAPGETARAVKLLGRNGVEVAVNLSGGPPGGPLEAQLAAAKETGGHVVVFTGVDWRGFGEAGWSARAVADLERAKALGAKGLKIYKHLGLGLRDPEGRFVLPDDARLDELFDAAGRLGLPVAIHTGDPKAFFAPDGPENERHEELALNPAWSFSDLRYPRWEALFAAFEARLARSPDTTFIGVHFGNDPEDPARVGRLLDAHPNLVVDTAARIGELGRDDVPGRRALTRQVILDHPKRVLFGTDVAFTPGGLVLGAPSPEPATPADLDRFYALHRAFFETAIGGLENPIPIQGRWTVSGLDLPREILEDLYHRNAERLLGVTRPPPPRWRPR